MITIDALELTSFDVLPDGSRIRIHACDSVGERASISMPTSCLNKLMMTLPAMLRMALQKQFNDSSLRLVHELRECQVEQMAGTDGFILTLKTPDGFEVSFDVDRRQAARLAETVSDYEDSTSDRHHSSRLLI